MEKKLKNKKHEVEVTMHLGSLPNAPTCPQCRGKFGSEVGGFVDDSGRVVCSRCNPKLYNEMAEIAMQEMAKLPKKQLKNLEKQLTALYEKHQRKQREIQDLHYIG